ncbi:MAG TPA: ATP-binding cassette domain-containing protein [Microbacteriaceae bacterium]
MACLQHPVACAWPSRPKNVSKMFSGKNGDVLALQEVSLRVDESAFVCVVGPSGCGKPTLLRILGGLETATSGAVTSSFEDTNVPASAFVFQEHGVFPWFNVLDNVAFGIRMAGIRKPERIAIVRAFATGSPCLLMDEPRGAQTRILITAHAPLGGGAQNGSARQSPDRGGATARRPRRTRTALRSARLSGRGIQLFSVSIASPGRLCTGGIRSGSGCVRILNRTWRAHLMHRLHPSIEHTLRPNRRSHSRTSPRENLRTEARRVNGVATGNAPTCRSDTADTSCGISLTEFAESLGEPEGGANPRSA